ncbi:MAG TPA: hypothetical protein VKH43_08295 [Thermoanaerobaculia bacterium]|nr:hypothetical protein [Thermoanaerobaculia bacterium]
MLRNGWRRASAAYLALFFLAVAAAPHHHLNGLEDLLLDQRSDSGVLIQTIGVEGTSRAPALNPFRVVHDVPCLACFTGDFVCATAQAIHFAASHDLVALAQAPLADRVPELVPADSSSRAPPALS